jgi:4-hydroxy-tetrahydrodipicolinate synthase
MTTPFDRNDNVNYSSIRDHVNFLIERGVDCLYPCGTTGEAHLLSVDERKKIAETVVDEAAGRVTVYIHTGAMTQKDTVELSRHAAAIGADGVGAVTPCYFSVNDREMAEYYISIAKSVPEDFPVYLYNIPQCAANDLTADVAEQIVSKAKNVIGIKYSFLDMGRTRQYLSVNGGNFSVLHGADKFLTSLLPLGLDGTVSGVSSVYPEGFVNALKAYQNGDMALAKRELDKAAKVCDILQNGKNMAYFKAAMTIRGLDGGSMRKPLLDLTVAETEKLRKELQGCF